MVGVCILKTYLTDFWQKTIENISKEEKWKLQINIL